MARPDDYAAMVRGSIGSDGIDNGELVLADWLDEGRHADLASFWRIKSQLKNGRDSHRNPLSPEQKTGLEQQLIALLQNAQDLSVNHCLDLPSCNLSLAELQALAGNPDTFTGDESIWKLKRLDLSH